MNTRIQRIAAITAGFLLTAGVVAGAAFSSVSAETPTPTPLTCATYATPMAGSGPGEPGMNMSEDDSHSSGHMGMEDEVPFDLFYIDMMIPHHESVIALAIVARDELTDPELIAMADAIIATQGDEVAQLEAWRAAWYPDAEPVTMEQMMGMPGLEQSMNGMGEVMSSEWQMMNFCSAADPDLAFIDQVIPHHQMAIDVSEAAATQAEHQELADMAEAVVTTQQAEIDQLERIRLELTGMATPAA
ncbi:MAG: DUF305 domain-containing protein [Thermomicrobiales bacterium]